VVNVLGFAVYILLAELIVSVLLSCFIQFVVILTLNLFSQTIIFNKLKEMFCTVLQ